MHTFALPAPPPAPTDDDATRWAHTRLRERMLAGLHRADVVSALEAHMGHTRTAGMNAVDMSSNILRTLAVELAVLYDLPPALSHPDAAAEPMLGETGLVAQSGFWEMMIGVQRQTIALNEAVVAIGLNRQNKPIYRPVSPSFVCAEAAPDEPDRPVALRELRLRKHPRADKWLWAWDVWDTRGVPSFRVEAVTTTPRGKSQLVDMTADYVVMPDGTPATGPLTGEQYPWYDGDKPILPYVIYHSARSAEIWRPWEGVEVVEGALTAAVGWSFWVHCLRDASWPQRYAVGARVAGAVLEDSAKERRSGVVTDPATVVFLEPVGEGQALVGQWAASSDPSALADCLSMYEARVASFAGVSASDLQRLGGEQRSGYAISVSNAGKRVAQRRFAPGMKRGDLEVVCTTAAMVNTATGSKLPTSGYELRYASVPKSPEERDAERRDVLERLEAGLIDVIEAHMLLDPSLSRPEAIARAKQIQANKAAIVAASTVIV